MFAVDNADLLVPSSSPPSFPCTEGSYIDLDMQMSPVVQRLRPCFPFSWSKDRHHDLGQSVADHRRPVCLSLLPQLDPHLSQLKLTPPVRPIPTLVQYFNSTCLFLCNSYSTRNMSPLTMIKLQFPEITGCLLLFDDGQPRIASVYTRYRSL